MNTILLLASEPEVHHIFKQQLEKFKLQVMDAYDLDQARQQLDDVPPSLLLVDLDQLVEGFVDFYHWILRHPMLRDMPRIFIAGRESRHTDIVALLQRSGEVLLNKPLQRTEFLRALKDLLKRRTRSFSGAALSTPPTSSMPAAAPMPQQALPTGQWLGRQVGSVMLQREIGRGGMGAVFLGFQSTLNRKVAVKMILPELINNATMMARFQREALAMARLKSPHIVQVFDAGYTDDGTFFMVMEFLEGQDLEEVLRQQGTLTIQEALDVMEHVLKGLIAAHEAGIIHRDLKPSNFIRSTTGHTTVTDFGLAQQHTDLRFTREGALLGTPYYFAPEQANGAGSDARSDIYSLGIVLYELLVGSVPFPSSNLTEVLYQHAHKPMPDPRQYVPGIPDGLVDILMKMTAKEPARRFGYASEVLQAIEDINHSLPTLSFGGDGLLPKEDRTLLAEDNPFAAAAPLLQGAPQQPLPTGMRELNVSAVRSQVASPSRSLQTSGLSLPLDPGHCLGAFALSLNGSVQTKSGHFSPMWSGALQILQAVLAQLQSVVQMGALQYTLCEAEQELLVLMPNARETEGMTFALNAVPASLRMSISPETTINSLSMSTSLTDPLVHLSSTAGVEGLMLLTAEGVLRHHVLPAHVDPAIFASRISPLAALFSSLPTPLSGIDCCFEQGRTLLWKVEQQYLVVLATHQLNKSLLAILIQQQRDLLRSFVPSGRAARFEKSGDSIVIEDQPVTIPDDDASEDVPLTKEELAAIAKEFARFIGPMARLLLKQEAKKLGFSTKTLPHDQAPALIEKLGAHLESAKRKEFLEIARQMIK